MSRADETDPEPDGDLAGVRVRGTSDPDELAAVLALMVRRAEAPIEDPYRRWRRTRLAALRLEDRRTDRDTGR